MKKIDHQVRIIGGVWRSRRVTVADSVAVRPTPNRVRETLFNWLQPFISDAECLDLFSGSGALGIEAVSRGARSAVLVESERKVAEVLRNETQKLQSSVIEIICQDAYQYLTSNSRQFDIIFLDPPFDSISPSDVVTRIVSANVLRPYGYIYLEYAARHVDVDLPDGWSWRRQQSIGDVGFGLIAARPGPE